MSILRQRTKYYIYAGLFGAMLMLVVSATGIYYYDSYADQQRQAQIEEFEERIKEAEELLKEREISKIRIYVLKHDVPEGKMLQEEDLEMIEMPKDILPTNIADPKNVIGKITKIEARKNTPILESMLFEEGITPNDLRSSEYSFITLPLKLKKDDFVDVRIFFPTGQDYIVLSKKKVKDLEDGTVWHELNEEEILRVSSAIVDAYLNNAHIYSLKYVDPYMQSAATVTYPANSYVLDLMQIDPNVVNYAMKELETRHRKILESGLDEHREKYMINETQNKEILEKHFGEKQYPQFQQSQEETSNQEEMDENSVTDPFYDEAFNEPTTNEGG